MILADCLMMILLPTPAMAAAGEKTSQRPNQVAPGSSDRVWWICAQGHEWEASISSRAIGGHCYHVCVGGTQPKRMELYQWQAVDGKHVAREGTLPGLE